MNQDIKAQWLKALRSGKYQQGFKYLRSDETHYCPLGVLCDIVDPSGWHVVGVIDPHYFHNETTNCLGREVFAQARLYDVDAHNVMAMNDGKRYAFSAIAQWIEENV